MQEWEEPSWIARSAVFVPENFVHTPVWVIHGELDRSIGGGVPVAHSRRMTELLAAEGCPHTYTEVPGAGHGYASQAPDLDERVLLWVIRQRKRREPDHVRFATYTLRHNRSYWVSIEQLDRYGERGSVDARFVTQDQMTIRTENVRALTLGPIPERALVEVNIDEQVLPDLDLRRPQAFRRDGTGSWNTGDFDLGKEKRPGCSGPIADLFFEQTILVPGTVGDEVEATFNRAVAGHQARLYRERDGGVHRGGIMGQNDVVLPIIADTEITDEQIGASNSILYGTFESNAVMKRFEGRLPVAFEGTTIRVGGKTYAGDQTTVFAVLPHPDNPGRYVAVHGGVTPDAIIYGSHIDMGLLPDYLVYSGGEVLDWGFWGNDWKAQD
jgi:hypothetical protein